MTSFVARTTKSSGAPSEAWPVAPIAGTQPRLFCLAVQYAAPAQSHSSGIPFESVIGAFCWVTSYPMNTDPATAAPHVVYLDDIVWE